MGIEIYGKNTAIIIGLRPMGLVCGRGATPINGSLPSAFYANAAVIIAIE
jgi:hypothetical protein